MKKGLIILAAIALSMQFQSCGTLSSTTYIDADKSFVLGEGKHGRYTAKVKNAGNTEIEVIEVNKAGMATSFGVLQQGDKQQYPVAKNKTIQFKNKGKDTGIIKIRAKGDTKLSMGYQVNEKK